MYEEFTDFKIFSISEPSDTALTDALIASYEDHDEYRLDTIWYHLYQMKNLIGSDYRFCNLFNVACLVLVTPHSNTGIECVYSLVNKMDQPKYFSKYYDFQPSQKLLKEAKKAVTKYND